LAPPLGVLRAVGKRRDGATCEDEVRTAGPPVAIRLIADRDTITDTPGGHIVSIDMVEGRVSSRSSGISGMMRNAASMKTCMRSTSCAGRSATERRRRARRP